jgi:hypothetical protein
MRLKHESWKSAIVLGTIKMLTFTDRCSSFIVVRIVCLVALVSTSAAPAIIAQEKPVDAGPPCPPDTATSAAKVGQYVFRTVESEDGACLEVSQNGKVIYRQAGFAMHYYLGQKAEPQWGVAEIPNGKDLTGRGHPDMVVSGYTGGAHCCSMHYVFELEPEFKLLAKLKDAHDDMAHFEKIDRGYLYVTADWTFAYWPSCFACSPSERVILKFVDDQKGGGYHLALDQMQRPAPTSKEWEQEQKAVRDALNGGPAIDEIGHVLWNPILDLIYSGHSDLAWKFIDEAGPRAQKEPLPDLADFCSLLKSSLYWSDLEPTLRNIPPACVRAKSRGK